MSSMKMGGIINELESSELDILYDIGLNLGIAFQIQDDYLDLFGEEKIIGKRVGQDVVNNKKTALHHLFINTASKTQLSKYNDYISISTDNVKIDKIKSLFIESDVENSLKKLIQDYSNNATSDIESLHPKFPKNSNLILLSELLLKRNY